MKEAQEVRNEKRDAPGCTVQAVAYHKQHRQKEGHKQEEGFNHPPAACGIGPRGEWRATTNTLPENFEGEECSERREKDVQGTPTSTQGGSRCVELRGMEANTQETP